MFASFIGKAYLHCVAHELLILFLSVNFNIARFPGSGLQIPPPEALH